MSEKDRKCTNCKHLNICIGNLKYCCVYDCMVYNESEVVDCEKYKERK